MAGDRAGLSGTAAELAPGPGALGRETPAGSDLTQPSPRPAAGAPEPRPARPAGTRQAQVLRWGL